MTSLASLQRDLQKLIVDGDESIASAIDSSDEIPAATRLKIYSDAYRLRLIEALQANFPVLERLLGADQFARVTQLYLSIRPSRHFSIRWFGHELQQFLREFDEYRDQPWLAELAEWEWKVAMAFDEHDTELLTIDAVAGVTPEDWPGLNFFFHPSVQRVGLTTNATAIAKASGEEQPLPQPVQLAERTESLIWRQDLIVRYRSLDVTESAAIDAVRTGATFGELCETIAQHVAADEVPLRAATLLRRWIDDQLLARVPAPH